MKLATFPQSLQRLARYPDSVVPEVAEILTEAQGRPSQNEGHR